MKVAIVGAGAVGSAAAFAIVLRGAAGEVVLVDVNSRSRARRPTTSCTRFPSAAPYACRPATMATSRARPLWWSQRE